jgi:hypothetical protein
VKNAKKKSMVLLFKSAVKVHIFREGHKVLQNLHPRFVLCSNGQIYGGDFPKSCGLLKIYELEFGKKVQSNYYLILNAKFLNSI